MLEPLMYVVSAVLKFWHWVLLLLGFESSLAWTISIFLLLITVRSLLVPLQVKTLLNSRKLALARPLLAAAKQEHGGEHMNADQSRKFKATERKIHKEHGYSTATGCFIPLIQLPIFLGLFRVLTSMARPQEGFEAAHAGVGVLSGQDVDEFLKADIAGIPLPAYVAMSPEQFAWVGTDRETVLNFVLPFLVLATILSVMSIVTSLHRSKRVMDYSITMSVKMMSIMRIFVLAGFMLLIIGLTGPAPVALVLYWCAGNGWTLLQGILIETWLNWKYPLTAAFFYYQAQEKDKYFEKAEVRDREKKLRRRRKWAKRFQPWKRHEINELMAADAAAKEEQKKEESEQKAHLKKVNAHLNAIYRRKKRILMESRKLAKSAAQEGLEINPHQLAVYAISIGAADIDEDHEHYFEDAVDIAAPRDIPASLQHRAEMELGDENLDEAATADATTEA